MSRRAVALAVAALLLAGCGSKHEASGTQSQSRAAAAPAGRPAALTPAQLAGQHVVFPFAGRTPPRALLARIRRGEAAGVIFLGANIGTPAQVRAVTRRLQAVPRPPGLRAPLLLMVDQEGGSVKRLPGAPSRGAPQMGATGRPSVARAEGRATAATLRAAGMNVDLAPVVDVVRPESALHAEGRGFGFTAPAAARFGAAFARGLQDRGVAATAKHFPGFGAAPRNTDAGVVRIGVSLHELHAVDRVPFRSAINAGAALVMLSSAVYPALSSKPAALSPRVVQGELRGGLGFKGVTISDDLEGPAFAAYGGPTGAGVQASRAGVDLLLYARTYGAAARAADGLAAAIRRGDVDRVALEASRRRIQALRASLG
ncbi:MAG TPA: glycoside hydrolase family 3 N-terminal domain-containing protein [Solirubrobacteraceae bacterium]